MLSNQDRIDLKWACQSALLERCLNTGNYDSLRDFILKEATYEQLLNLALSPNTSNEVYYESRDLELYTLEIMTEMCVGQDLDTYLLEAENEEKKPSKLKKAAKVAALGAGLTGAAVVGAGIGDAASTYKRAKKGKGMGRALTWPLKAASWTAKKVGSGAKHVAKGAGKVAGYAGKAAYNAGKGVATSPQAKGAGLATAAAVGGYLLYRKLRNSGKSKEQAAAQVANVAKTPQEKAKWQKMSKGSK